MIFNKQFTLEINQIVRSNYQNVTFNVNTLCKMLNIKKSLMYRICIYNVQCTPQEYIEKIRLEIAAEKLKQNEILIKDVALHVGFCDTKNFSKVFKQKYGTSPYTFKKQLA